MKSERCTRDDVYSFITKGGLEGRTFGEIQRFVVEKNGRDYDDRVAFESWDKNGIKMITYPRKNRGYWCTNLCGLHGNFQHREGILELCSVKVGKRYVSKKFADLI